MQCAAIAIASQVCMPRHSAYLSKDSLTADCLSLGLVGCQICKPLPGTFVLDITGPECYSQAATCQSHVSDDSSSAWICDAFCKIPHVSAGVRATLLAHKKGTQQSSRPGVLMQSTQARDCRGSRLS